MKRRLQLDHHLYSAKFEVEPSSIERYAEYRWATQACNGLRVLDFGCNTGFGSALIAQNAHSVFGIDVVQAAIDVAKTEFPHVENLDFELVPEDRLPDHFTNFQAVTAFNIIEHFPDPSEKLKQMRKTLCNGGKLLLTTVNRELRLYPWQRPWNDLHHIEFSSRSLAKLLSRHFSRVSLMGLHFNGPFFPNLAETASRRKFQIAIEYPVRDVLRRTVRPWLAMMFPKRFHTNLRSTINDKVMDAPSSTQERTITFDDALSQILINDSVDKCVKILAIATV